jgi:hypothetical protein
MLRDELYKIGRDEPIALRTERGEMFSFLAMEAD